MKTRKHKIASVVLLMIFLSQQISWACGYNLSLLVNLPPSSLIYKDHGEFNRWVAKRVYSLAKPSFQHNPQDLKSAYQWLKQPATETVPCSAYVLYNLLLAKGIKPKIEDISTLLISHDLKAGNLKPPFTQNKIYNSLYSLTKTAESQGLTLYPARLNPITPELLNSQTPFIAHLFYGGQSGHFVLVTKIDTEKVYFLYDKGDTFLPYEKFLEEFSGYCLLSPISVRTEHCSVPAISDSEAKSILGAGRAYHGRSVNISSLFKKPSTLESVIGIGTAIGGAFTMGMGGSGWGSLAASGIKIGGSMLFKDSQWGQIGTSIVAGAVGGGINGAMGAESTNMWKEAFQGAGVGAAKSATISGTMYGISQVKIANLSPSVMASIGQLVAVPLGNAVGRGLQMGFDLPLYDGSGNRMGTASQLGIKGGFGTGFWQGLTFQTPESWREKVSFRDKWGGALQHYGSETASIAIEVFAPGKYSSAYGMGLNSAFSVFTNTNDSWSKALGISIGKGVAMGGASLLLANLTKDMRVTEGAFLEKAVSSVAGAGVEAIFGYNKKAEAYVSTSRWGIFSKSLTDNWMNTSKSIVTFGNPSGNFLNYQGGYAIAKMHTFGSDIAALKKGGLKSFDAVRYAWNQYVGSSLHYSAINDFSSIAENRLRGVKYANVGKEMHKIELQGLSKFTNDKDFLKSGGRAIYDLTAQKYIPQTFTYDDQATGIMKSIIIGESGLLPADYSKEDAEFLKIEQKYLESKINSLNDAKLPQKDFMIRYPMVSEELEKTVVFSPDQKVALRQDLKKVSDDSFKRFSGLGRDYAKEYNYTPQSDEDILNAELDYMTKKIQKFDGTKGNYDRISKDIETSAIFKLKDKEAFKMALALSPAGGNSAVQSSKAEEANKRDYAKEYNYTPQSDADILKEEQDYLKNKIAKANQEIGKLNDNIVFSQKAKKGLNEAYDKIYSKMSQEIKNTVVFAPGEKEKLEIGKFEPIEQNWDTGGWKVGDKSFNSINKAKEYQNKQRIQQPAILPNSSPTSNVTATVITTSDTASVVPEIVEGGNRSGRSFHVNGRVFKAYEEAVKYRDELKAANTAPAGSSHTPKMSAMTIGEMIAEADTVEGGNTYLSGASAEKPNAVIMVRYSGSKEDITTDANGRQYEELKKTEQVKAGSKDVNDQGDVFNADMFEHGKGQIEDKITPLVTGMSEDEAVKMMTRAQSGELFEPGDSNIAAEINSKGWDAVKDSLTGVRSGVNHEEKADILGPGWEELLLEKTDKTAQVKVESKNVNKQEEVFRADNILGPGWEEYLQPGGDVDIDTKVSAAKDEAAQLENDMASIPHTQKPLPEITSSIEDPAPYDYDVDNAKNMPLPDTNPYLNTGAPVNPTLGEIERQDTLKQEALNDKFNAAPPAQQNYENALKELEKAKEYYMGNDVSQVPPSKANEALENAQKNLHKAEEANKPATLAGIETIGDNVVATRTTTANWEYLRGDEGKIKGLTIDLSGNKLDIPYATFHEVEDVKIREVNKDTVKELKEEPKVYITFKDKNDNGKLLTVNPDTGDIVKEETILFYENGEEMFRHVMENKLLPSSGVNVLTSLVIDGKGNPETDFDTKEIIGRKKAWDTKAKRYVPYQEFIDKNKGRDATITPAQDVAPTQMTPSASPNPQPTATQKATGGDYLNEIKILQNSFEFYGESLNKALDIISMANELPVHFNVSEELPIKEVVKNGTSFYKIQGDPQKYGGRLTQIVFDIDFPSMKWAEGARDIYIKRNSKSLEVHFLGAYKNFNNAKQELFNYYNKDIKK